MEISNLAGLPAHPLVVHAVVVLVPLAAIGVLLSAVWPAARSKIGWISLGFATLVLILVPLAAGSGESLEERVDETRLVEEHAEMGQNLLPWVIVLFVAAVAVMAFAWYRKRQAASGGGGSAAEGSSAKAPGWVKVAAPLVIVLALVGAVGSVVEVGLIGHSGAKATWDDTPAAESGGG